MQTMIYKNLFFLTLFLLVLNFTAQASQSLWVTSLEAKVYAEKSAFSTTIETLSRGTEVSVVQATDRWYEVMTPAGKNGWIYQGKVSRTAPKQESMSSGGDLFGSLGDSSIQAQKADTSRSIRGLSPETQAYADRQGTPEKQRQALDWLLTYSITYQEVENFLKKGHVGQYAQAE